MKQKGKADAPEEQGKMSREFVYLLDILRPEGKGDVPGYCLMKSREGRVPMIKKDGLGKEGDSLWEEELPHKLGGR